MGYLAEIVNLDTVSDDGGLHLGPVYRRTRSDLDIVPDNHIAKVLNLLPSPVRERGVAESVRTDHGIGVDDDIIPYHHSGIDHDTRVDYAVLTNHSVVTDIYILKYLGVVADLGMMADIGVASEIDLLAELGGQEPG